MDTLDQTLHSIAVGIRDLWVDAARRTLNTSLSAYIGKSGENIRVIKRSKMLYEVVLGMDGDMANKIESGSGPYDLKPLILRGSLSRIVPFTLGDVIGGEVSSVGGSASQSGGATGQQDVTRQVLRAMIATGLPTLSQSKLTALAAEGMIPTGAAQKLKSHHKSSIYAGLSKLHRSASNARRNRSGGGGESFTGGTFRTISSNSSAGSWKHPGFKARNISGGVLRDALSTFGGDLKVNGMDYKLNISVG